MLNGNVRAYGGCLLGAAVVAATALMSARAHLLTLLFLRSHGLLNASEASMPGVLGAILISQTETLVAWVLISVLVAGVLGVWLPSMRTPLTGILGLVGLSHLPLLVWSVGTTAITNVLLSDLAGESALAHLSADQVQERVIAISGTLLAAKAVAYLVGLALCIASVRRTEGASWRVATTAVVSASIGSWVIGYLL